MGGGGGGEAANWFHYKRTKPKNIQGSGLFTKITVENSSKIGVQWYSAPNKTRQRGKSIQRHPSASHPGVHRNQPQAPCVNFIISDLLARGVPSMRSGLTRFTRQPLLIPRCILYSQQPYGNTWIKRMQFYFYCICNKRSLQATPQTCFEVNCRICKLAPVLLQHNPFISHCHSFLWRISDSRFVNHCIPRYCQIFAQRSVKKTPKTISNKMCVTTMTTTFATLCQWPVRDHASSLQSSAALIDGPFALDPHSSGGI